MIRNLVEEHVQVAYEALRGHFPEFCGCDICREDALVFALNRIRPRYVSTLEGEVVTGVSLEQDQNRAAIEVAMMDGLRKISLAPRCRGQGRDRARPA